MKFPDIKLGSSGREVVKKNRLSYDTTPVRMICLWKWWTCFTYII